MDPTLPYHHAVFTPEALVKTKPPTPGTIRVTPTLHRLVRDMHKVLFDI
jgi:hypothetical protein